MPAPSAESSRPARARARALALALPLLAACSSDKAAGPSNGGAATLIVDASTVPAFVAFGATAADTLTVATPATSTAWHLQFFATNVTLNGGAAGPGDVSGYCLCQNAAASDDQVGAMTAAGQLAAFTNVSAANIPADSDFVADALVPVVEGWYAGTPGAAVAPDTTHAWIVRRAGDTTFAKFRVIGITGASAGSPGMVTVQYAVQPNSAAAFGAPDTVVLNAALGDVKLNFGSGATGTALADWDIALVGYQIRVDGGASGSAGVGAVFVDNPPFDAIDVTLAGQVPPSVYEGDAFGGVFATNKWYRYNITGSDNQIWPTFDVFLIKVGTTVWKVQLIGYYDASFTPRHITFRYAKLKG